MRKNCKLQAPARLLRAEGPRLSGSVGAWYMVVEGGEWGSGRKGMCRKLKEMYYLCRQDERIGAKSGQAQKLP